ncbi:MAG: transposase [Haloquadratum sp. J07HQX50]|nr:MAG: transposase [Haloquadratum sp. J07HQX50]
MPHHTLIYYIKYKPRFAGLGVKIVNEYMTGQTCWRCGEKEDTKQVGQHNHVCDECELNDNCDNNGATDIREKGLGKDIQPPATQSRGCV